MQILGYLLGLLLFVMVYAANEHIKFKKEMGEIDEINKQLSTPMVMAYTGNLVLYYCKYRSDPFIPEERHRDKTCICFYDDVVCFYNVKDLNFSAEEALAISNYIAFRYNGCNPSICFAECGG